MPLTIEHSWNPSSSEAYAIQEELASKVERTCRFDYIQYIAGVAAHIRDDVGRAAVVVLDKLTLKPVDIATVQQPVTFPYRPGLATFREGPFLLEALERLVIRPDLLMIDGSGIAHPRRLGIASHIGLLVDLPTIGCTHRWLVDQPPNGKKPPQLDQKVGSYAFVKDGKEVLGAILRTQANADPMHVSIGHRVDLETCMRYVLACCRQNNFPEPNRWARHFLVSSA